VQQRDGADVAAREAVRWQVGRQDDGIEFANHDVFLAAG
jgi:hypothetical protein